MQQVIDALEEDFPYKLENASSDQLKAEAIAKSWDLVNNNVRAQLDELRRIQIDRWRYLVKQERHSDNYDLGS